MKKRYIIPTAIIIFSAVITLICRLSPKVADFYADYIFPVISTPYVFLSGLFPFSLGEVMIILLIVVVAVGVPVAVILLIFGKNFRRKTADISLTAVLFIVAFVALTESLNCFTLYGCTRFSERFFESAEHDNEELKRLYVILAEKCNELSAEVPRDENNRFILTVDVADECRAAMKKASEKYPQLKGYYPKPKAIMFSYFMSQTGTAGMYFPFSMESTYNGDMVREDLPEVVCHEYSHLKGFMQEDESNFISFIATSMSDSKEVQYSGYLSALEYVHNQIYSNEIFSGYSITDTISQEVKNDWFRFLPENYWEENEEKEIIPTETVSTVYETAADTSMKMNGVEDGRKSYSRMVNLLLDYYFPSESQSE